PTDVRWHLLSTQLTGGVINVDGNLEVRLSGKENDRIRFNGFGAKVYGYAFGNVGYFFNMVTYREKGEGINRTKIHTPDPGIIVARSYGNVLEYNTTEAQFTIRLGEFDLSLEKMQNVWGSGERGNLIFSHKAPSAPQLKMRVPLTPWLDFIYLHADLNSRVIDSVRSYHAGSSGIIDFFRPVDRLKYLAAHQLEFTIVDGLDLAIGESIVYSDRGPQLIYLIPIMFFKSGEHYNRDTDNVQFFGSLDVNLVKGLNFSLTLFIDEINTDELFNPDKHRNQLGYTAGLRTYDLPLENLELLVEYSRLNPWMYSHKYPAATFTNNGYDLGHWIGQNADNVYVEAKYWITGFAQVGGWWESYRKGGLEDVAFQYRTPSLPFLYGPVRKDRSIGGFAQWQFARDAFLDVRAGSRTVTDEALPQAGKSDIFEFTVALRYGIW
ncbi:MAG: capsule assembly Wzi family protein, partial [Bacteroidota bacterium]